MSSTQGVSCCINSQSPGDAASRIAETIAPELKKRALYFVGLDVIADKVTEINVTSPTGIRELHKLTGVNLAAELFDRIEQELSTRQAAA